MDAMLAVTFLVPFSMTVGFFGVGMVEYMSCSMLAFVTLNVYFTAKSKFSHVLLTLKVS